MSKSTVRKMSRPGANNASKVMVDALAGVLGDTFQLFVNTQTCHWNVVGPNFVALHDLFGKQYEELHAAVDELAERIRSIGHPAPIGLGALKALSSQPDGLGKGTAEDMVASLIDAHEKLIAGLVKSIEVADEVDDDGTEDLLIGRLRAHQKMLWMLKSSL